MKGLSFVASLTGALLLLDAAQLAAGNTEPTELHGKWIVESFQYNGNPVDRLKEAIREFKDGKYSLTPKMGDAITGDVKLDTSKSPKTIDLDVNGRVLHGIYQLDGDTLKMCYNLTRDDRPTEFVSTPDSGLIVVIHKREK
ncbi:MAG: TIGR03067 domain-containing protein [Pirellulales bacterium]